LYEDRNLKIQIQGKLRLNFRIKEIRKYFSMICVILYNKEKVMNTDPIEYKEDFPKKN